MQSFTTRDSRTRLRRAAPRNAVMIARTRNARHIRSKRKRPVRKREKIRVRWVVCVCETILDPNEKDDHRPTPTAIYCIICNNSSCRTTNPSYSVIPTTIRRPPADLRPVLHQRLAQLVVSYYTNGLRNWSFCTSAPRMRSSGTTTAQSTARTTRIPQQNWCRETEDRFL